MDGFIIEKPVTQQDDGLRRHYAPVHYEEREKHARKLAVSLKLEGYQYAEALNMILRRNKDCFRPELEREAIISIVGTVFASSLLYHGLNRNRAVLDLINKLKGRGQDEEEVLSRVHLFNKRCCNPPLLEEDISCIYKLA